LPPFNSADCHLSIWLIATLCSIRPECHITLAWVPVYSFGLSAT
jgi:hypothetical protein